MIRLILLAAIIIFYAIRWRPSVLRRATKNKINTRIFIWEIIVVALIVVQLTDLDPLKFQVPQFVNYIGLVVALVGAAIASVARVTMKKNYVPATAAGVPESLTTGGIYKIVRHPAYLGTALAFIGFELALSSYLIFASLILLVEMTRQINKEEKMLSEFRKEAWQAFVKKTPYKLVPFIY
jgi:protein-S-isoprenylcysteine O-methyltransferase Ste14